MLHRNSRRVPRRGFSLVELVIAMTLLALAMAIVVPNFGKALTASRVKNAAAVLRADMERAFSLASRQGRPVRIVVDESARVYRIENRDDAEVLYERRFGADSEFPLATLMATPTEVEVFPNGLASGPLEMTLKAGDQTMRVRMTRTGLVRTEGS